MSAMDPDFAVHLEQPVTTLCHCWRVQRRDGTVLGFTDHDRTLMLAGEAFEPQTGFSASEARQSLGLAVNAMDVAGALSSSRISATDIELGLYDGAAVETWLVNWRAPQQRMLVARDLIGRISRRDGEFVAELLSPMQALDSPSGRYFRRACDADLGDEACGFNLDQPGYRAGGTVIAMIAGNRLRAAGLAGFAEDWFSLGWLEPANGEPVKVARHLVEGGEALLMLELPAALQPDDAFTIVAGCDKRFTTCKAKFSNALNFRGFPHLPGNDAAYAYVRDDLTFDGGPLVP